MRRLASVGFLVFAVIAPVTASADEHCSVDPVRQKIVCDVSGGGPVEDVIIDPGDDGSGDKDRTNPPIRYLKTGNDPVVGPCYYWSRTPGGLDTWDAANDAAVIGTIAALDECPGPVTVVPPTTRTEIENTAWNVFRSWQLLPPALAVQPPNAGIVGVPVFVSANPPPPIAATVSLPDGRSLEVFGTLTALDVDWGDGEATRHVPSDARPYPSGVVTHTYVTKTCTPEYRAGGAGADRCHATLDAYPIAATYTWSASYRVSGGSTVDLGAITLSTTVAYDIDEVIGVVTP